MERYAIRCQEMDDNGEKVWLLAQTSNNRATARAMARQFHSMTWLHYIVVDRDMDETIYDTDDEREQV